MSGEQKKTPSFDGDAPEAVYYYGWCSVRPSRLQCLNKGVWILVFLTAANTTVSGTYNGLSGAVQSSLETRFQLTSTQSSWIMTSFDVASVFAGVLFAYIGSKPSCHRPRVIWISLVVALFACLIYALPHFTTPVYEPTGNKTERDDLCRNRSSEDVCGVASALEEESRVELSIQNYLYVFIIARVLLSFGVTPITMLGLTWLDDCVSKEVYSFYSGIFVFGWIGGPALGFVFGGMFLSIYTDFTSDVEVDIDATDPRWVGAWWLGFLLAAVVLLIIVVPLSGYPTDIPDGAEIRMKKKSEAYNAASDVRATGRIDFTAKQLLSYLKYLFTNWTFVFLTLFVTCDIAIMAGFTVFGPKFVEIQYNLTSSQASILFGVLVVPASFIGSVAGGALVRAFKLSLTDILKWSIGLASAILLGSVFVLFYCPDASFAGVNQPYPHYNSEEMDVSHQCNEECDCTGVVFTPVCSNDEVQYYSPCHAGCTSRDADVYYNCSCLGNSTDAMVTDGVCPSNSCPDVIYFSVVIFILMVLLFANCAMDMTSMIRSVPPTHRVIGFLVYNMAQKILGAVPAPLIFGMVLDSSCQLSAETCDLDQGACYYYDKHQLGVGILITTIVYKALSIVFVILSWKLYKPPRDSELILEQEVTEKGFTTSSTSSGNVNNALENSDDKGYRSSSDSIEVTKF